MSLILGIDPGSRLTGFGFLNAKGKSLPTYVHSGVVRTQASDLPGRLGEIFTQLNQLIQTYRPDEVAIEQVFEVSVFGFLDVNKIKLSEGQV